MVSLSDSFLFPNSLSIRTLSHSSSLTIINQFLPIIIHTQVFSSIMDYLSGPPNYYQDDNAINEECCIHVLNILISKQDTDISELEDELMELLNQFACSDVEFSDMVSMSLRGNIDFLDTAVKKLKDSAGDFSSTSRQPAESINDMMKSLFCGYLRKKYQQVPAVNQSEKKKEMGSSSNANHVDKRKSVIINAIPGTRVKTEEDNSIYPCMSHISKYSAQGSFWSSLEKTNKCQKNPPNITTNDIIHKNTPICKFICQKRSLETQVKLKMVKSEPDNETIGPLSICVVESSQDPEAKRKQNTTRDLVLFDGESNPENHHQQPDVSLSVKKTLKKQQILNSQLMISSSPSLVLLEGPRKTYAMNYYTVPKLKAIAKERNLKGYSKFRKLELAELLGIELNEGKNEKKEAEKNGDTASSKDTGWAIAIAG